MLRDTPENRPWRELPPEDGKPGTLSRLFRRRTHAGVSMRFLGAFKAPGAPDASSAA